jgi:hypothetical protein
MKKRITKPKVPKCRERRYLSIDRASEVRLGYRIEATNQDKAGVPLYGGAADIPRAERTITITITITIPPDHAGFRCIRVRNRSIAYAT